MPLQNSQYDAIMREYNKKQLKNKRELDHRIQNAYSKIPELAQIDSQIAELSMKKARMLLLETSAEEFDLPQAIAQLSRKRETLLLSHGFSADYLQMHYECPRCQDTGYVGNQKCSCFRQATIDMLYTQSNMKEILEEENFTTFSFDYYPDDIPNHATGLTSLGTAHQAVDTAWDFIENFQESFDNLFFYGDTGVGKTFLSHCIAKELMDRAYCVMYFTAFDLFDILAKHTFSRDALTDDMTEYIFNCDLLIIDDLGTELTNSFVSSQLFLCIHERIMQKRSTIISTNLSLEQFADTYSERTFSRIASSYTMIKLFGNDIRIQKKLLGGT
ncbi:MAG: ATP-binding protein [Lachnospiraceae bacterium]|jgi:DNA replication protein DnaC